MDFNSFRVFLRVAELRSFSQAAESLFLTQPAVSKRVAALEHELGNRLFDRLDRQVQLTEAGRALLPHAHRILEELTDLRRSIANLGGTVSGTLAMGTSHHIGLHRLPSVLKDFSRHFPLVSLDIRFLDSESACRAVEQGTLELGIVTLPPAPLPHLEIEDLWRDRLHFVVSKQHSLAAEPSPSLEALLRYPAVLPAPATYTRDILEKALRERGLDLQVGMTTNYLETLKMLAVAGLGWALLPATMLDSELHSLTIPEMMLTRRLGIVTHARRTLSNAARAMVETCRSQCEAQALGEGS
jgi:DNA-binding transcriptional LysR family regulator